MLFLGFWVFELVGKSFSDICSVRVTFVKYGLVDEAFSQPLEGKFGPVVEERGQLKFLVVKAARARHGAQ